ncbi:MAG: hypothetical protein A3A86_02045 [Elusimicrobia bacterium RIFCSPLOWO2_01_FULL_60_11]|nr:MAG: hypothetical protein A3A86_02045 [Elusimicrobia bacterium RIFCSPLOWO2_01_FULL_60_11]
MILDSFPDLRSQVKRYGETHPHSLIEWENKVDPVLYELDKRQGVKKTKSVVEGKKIAFSGTGGALYDFLKEKGQGHAFTEPDLFLHVYSDLDDLALLRRVKEFPDETPRAEITDYWVGESAEASSILILNPEKA